MNILSGINNTNFEDFEEFLGESGEAAFYDPETGMINWFVAGTLAHIVTNYEVSQKPFICVPERISLDEKMIQNSEIVDRPEMPVVLENNVLSGVPLGCTLEIEDQRYLAEDSTIELHTAPGTTVQVFLRCWPYRNKELTYASPPA